MKRAVAVAAVVLAACGGEGAAVPPPSTAAGATSAGIPCPVTIPDGSFVPPEGYPPAPVEAMWYGGDELWTVLDPDGSYQRRKSVWWSVNFPGGAVEEQPEIGVTWRRLDDGTVHEHPAPGTNAYTPQEGDFMIAGIDPDESGCWEVTAIYKGAALSYVYLQP